ncbi:MAG: hypothetical protein QG564_1779 [Campylobacterota bacterium]|nr:hypothetical protein [Campylobacterota bacterium]
MQRRDAGVKKIRIFINGFGRIGRSAARIILENPELELVGINDLCSFEQMAYLLKYDSQYRTFPYEIKLDNHLLYVNNHDIRLFSHQNASDINIEALDIDIVLECTGMFLTVESNMPWIKNGAKRVIVSAPPSDAMPTYIFGVNHKEYKQEQIISNSSCSANAIVPIFKIIDKHFGIRSAMMSMYHSYTFYQNLLDNKHYSTEIRRTRSATQNIIPLASTAAKATEYFFPHLKGQFHAVSIRVPIPATTLYDLSISLKSSATKEEVNRQFVSEIESFYTDILDVTDTPKESSDYIKSPYSATINLPFTLLSKDNLLRISAWQDNEYGYAKRLVDMANVIGQN